MPNAYRADEHYNVRRHPVDKTITALVCCQCDFTVARHEFRRKATDGKCGFPIYNRMRGRMVQHVHSCHTKGSK